jgi:iron(III) transport system permease protein|tara:strand:- start:1290 stop:2942 length:1653 start_codon:yes stop_codon:yes gene_type:complete
MFSKSWRQVKSLPLWCWPLILLVFSFLTPVFTVLASLVTANEKDTWSHLVDTVLLEYVTNTFYLVMGVAVGVTSIGITSAWLVARCDFFGRRFFAWALVLPLAMPAYIIAYTYTGLLDFSGPLQSFLRDTFDWSYGDYYFPEIKSLGGAICMMSLVLYPYVYLLARTAFANQSASLFEAGQLAGLNARQRFFSISLPLARPTIVVGLSLALMETLADYGTVQYFGVNVFSTGIFRTWFGLGDGLAASQLSSLLLVVVLFLLGLEQFSRRKAKYVQQGGRVLRAVKLSFVEQILALLFCSVVIMLGFLLPFIQLAYWTIVEAEQVFDATFWQLTLNSLKLASITALLAVMLSLAFAYMQRFTRPNRFTASLVFLAGLGYALPGTIIAVGVMLPFSKLDHFIHEQAAHFGIETGLIFSGSLVMLVFAYLIRFLAVSLGNINTAMDNITPHIDEAAKTLGEKTSGIIWRVHLPLLKTSLLSSGLLVFVDTLKELPATMALRPFNFNTLAVRSFELANDEQLANAAPAVITIVLVGLIPVIWLNASMHSNSKTQ